MKKTFSTVLLMVAISVGASAESPRENQGAVTSEEADLYGLFVDKWMGGSVQVVHVARTAEAPTAKTIAEYAACLKGSNLIGPASPVPSLDLSETSLARKVNVKLVDPEKWHPCDPRIAIARGMPTARAVSGGFAAGLMTFSRAIFDGGHKVAVFSYGFVCGELCGSGADVIFDKTDSGWKQRNLPCGNWIS